MCSNNRFCAFCSNVTHKSNLGETSTLRQHKGRARPTITWYHHASPGLGGGGPGSGGGGGVLHNDNNDDTDVTPHGRPNFVLLGLKKKPLVYEMSFVLPRQAIILQSWSRFPPLFSRKWCKPKTDTHWWSSDCESVLVWRQLIWRTGGTVILPQKKTAAKTSFTFKQTVPRVARRAGKMTDEITQESSEVVALLEHELTARDERLDGAQVKVIREGVAVCQFLELVAFVREDDCQLQWLMTHWSKPSSSTDVVHFMDVRSVKKQKTSSHTCRLTDLSSLEYSRAWMLTQKYTSLNPISNSIIPPGKVFCR